MKKLLILLIYLPLLSVAQTSTITGNIIDKFNSTDNQPDATAKIQLFDVNKKFSLNTLDRDSVRTTTADILGNYNFKNIPAGNYIIYITSKGALVSPMFLFNALRGGTVTDKLSSISGFDFTHHQPELQTQIMALFDQSIKLSNEKKVNKYLKVEKVIDADIKKYLDAMPNEIKRFFGFFDGGKFGRDFKDIIVKPGIDESYTTVFDVYF